MLRSVDWLFVIDVLGQPVGTIIKGQAGADRLSQKSVKIYQPNMYNIPEERRSPLNRGGSLKSRTGKFKVILTGRTETTANSSQPSTLHKFEDQPNFSLPRNA